MVYNIIELNEKLTTELRVLAKEMGIRRPDAYKKEELIYKSWMSKLLHETQKNQHLRKQKIMTEEKHSLRKDKHKY